MFALVLYFSPLILQFYDPCLWYFSSIVFAFSTLVLLSSPLVLQFYDPFLWYFSSMIFAFGTLILCFLPLILYFYQWNAIIMQQDVVNNKTSREKQQEQKPPPSTKSSAQYWLTAVDIIYDSNRKPRGLPSELIPGFLLNIRGNLRIRSSYTWRKVWEWMGGSCLCEWIVIWKSENMGRWFNVFIIQA